MMYRVEAHAAQWIDRAAPLRFSFEGREYQGYSGDTISSALAAAGVPYLARSFKYHRPRSILSFANHDSNTLFQVDGVPNVRGDVTLLREGMRVSAVNTFGGLTRDRARVLDRFAPLLPVGFYYKAFHSKRWFPRWERMFRTLTGLGQVRPGSARQATPKRYGFCDVLVIGAGPSGVAAALAAAEAGAQVTLVEESPRLSGNGAPQALVQAAHDSPAITLFPATVAAGYYADHWVALAHEERMTKMRAKALVFATGAIDTPAVFRNNDLPGVMLASGAARLLARHGVAPGRRVILVAGNLDAYVICLELSSRGVSIAAIVELRRAPESDAAVSACAALGIPLLPGHAPYEAVRGPDGTVAGLTIAPLSAAGQLDASASRRIDCDAILMSVGWTAATQLFLQAGGSTRFSAELQQFVPRDLPPGIFAAGRMNGVYDLESRLADGRRAGSQAAAHAGFGVPSSAVVARSTRCPSHPFPIIDHPRAKNFVDFDEDLTVKDLENAAQEGFDSSELLKRYSTVGMGPSQGKHSNMNALRILARFRGLSVEQLGLTTARPMYHPVPMKLLAGRSFYPERRTAIDAQHGALNAVWMPAGNWRRPEYYAVSGESRAQSIDAEVHAVRNAVGLIDVGTLGKIEIHGPDSAELLDRVYAGRYSDLKVGMTRYGLMLDESGVIIDDGVIARLGAQHFYFTTTTGGSATVFRELLRLNALWGLDCALVNVTGHRAAFNFAGPSSRAILQKLTDIDLRDEAFPYLAVRTGHVAGAAARLMRVGFVGELGYEIHVASGRAPGVWQALFGAGTPLGLRPFGVEAQRVLRLEKGHFIVSQDTDGLTDPYEANAMWAVALKKPFFIGQRSLRILRARGPRQKLMGIELAAATPLPKECHLVIDQGAIAGRVTSVTHSRTLNKSIGLAMLSPDLAQVGRDIHIRIDNGELVAARVAAAPFYDPKNLRQKAAGSSA
ncbi:MAG TPA: 2Fe-2S iron-sulfur cluster-binding protein [Steroidobacteraceae bacterium]|nr:2Fe-2S iron-sulfur cluster-binding protein [Steroidobacteraceae bacterium]